jgi:hypothetical protein
MRETPHDEDLSYPSYLRTHDSQALLTRMMFGKARHRLTHYGIDRVFATNMATRVWMLAFGPVILGFIIGSLSVIEQGFYFTFFSLLALSVFLDMGFTRAVQVFTSHEFGGLALRRWAPMEGLPAARRRMADFGKAVLLAHLALALVAGVAIGLVGEVMFAGKAAASVKWHGPWWSVALASGASFLLTPMQTMLEAAGHVPYMAGVKLFRQMVTNLSLVGALWMGKGLYSAAVSAWIGFAIGLALTTVPYSPFWRQLLGGCARPGFSLLRELLPYQVRIAISWGAGYFVFSIMTPIAFAALGPEAAARVGLSWQIVGVISSMAFTIIQAKTPSFGTLLAKGRQEEALLVSRRAIRGATGVALLGFAALLLGVGCVRHFPDLGWPKLALKGVDRMLSELAIAVLAIAEVAKLSVLGLVAYVRSFKAEPFMPMFVVLAVVVPAACWFLAKRWGAEWLCLGYALGQFIAIPWTRSAARPYLLAPLCCPASNP